ncbi:MAG: hypothetical protein ABIT47_02270 [Candidatus Paceibacterota bacterium]
MFVTILFNEVGRDPVLSYFSWEGSSAASCRLRLFSVRKTAIEFGQKLPMNEQKEVLPKARELAESSECPDLRLRGGLAAMFGAFLNEFLNHPVDVLTLAAPQLCGFYEPTPEAPYDAAILWFHPDKGYQIVIAYTPEQALETVNSFDWAAPEDQDRWRMKIEKWKMASSTTQMLTIEGIHARLLSTVTLVHKTRSEAKRRAN